MTQASDEEVIEPVINSEWARERWPDERERDRTVRSIYWVWRARRAIGDDASPEDIEEWVCKNRKITIKEFLLEFANDRG